MKIKNRKNIPNEQSGYIQDKFNIDGVDFTFDFSGKIAYSNKNFLVAQANKNNMYIRNETTLISMDDSDKEIEDFKITFVKKVLRMFLGRKSWKKYKINENFFLKIEKKGEYYAECLIDQMKENFEDFKTDILSSTYGISEDYIEYIILHY